MGTVSLPSSGTNSVPHPLDPLADRFPRTLCRIFPRSLQSTSHWEVPKACYSPSLTVQRGPGHLHLKVASTLPEHIDATSSMVITHLNLRCHVSGRVTIPQWHLWLGQGLPVPKVPQKKSTNGQKKSTINQWRSIRQKPKKKSKNPKEKRPKKKKKVVRGSSASRVTPSTPGWLGWPDCSNAEYRAVGAYI